MIGPKSLTSFLLIPVLIAASLLATPACAGDVVRLHGAGASFPAPLYLRWFRDYYLAHPDVRVDYQAIGSGAGITNFVEGRLDFAGADLPMTKEQAASVEGGVVQLPIVAGAIAVIYNLDGVADLKLTRAALAGIFLGEIRRWNDPALAAANPGVELPDEPITVVVRSDASGTTYNMTRHLSAISEPFATSVGASMTPDWSDALDKSAALIKGRGNGGVAAYVQAIPGGIGFVEEAYTTMTTLRVAAVENKAGKLMTPTPESLAATLAGFKDLNVKADGGDPAGEDAYPIVAVSWLLFHRQYPPEKEAAIRSVLEYCLSDGQAVATRLGYIPLPVHIVKLIAERLAEIHAES